VSDDIRLSAVVVKDDLKSADVVHYQREFIQHRGPLFPLIASFSQDPQLVEKVRDIVGLYMEPPVNAVVPPLTFSNPLIDSSAPASALLKFCSFA